MCTYLTETVAGDGSGKGAGGWFTLTQASVYVNMEQWNKLPKNYQAI